MEVRRNGGGGAGPDSLDGMGDSLKGKKEPACLDGAGGRLKGPKAASHGEKPWRKWQGKGGEAPTKVARKAPTRPICARWHIHI